MYEGFLPVNREDMLERGWTQPDFVYVMGDAYVDHSSFGPAIISRVLEAHGYKVAMLPQPDWNDPSSVMEFGEPRLGFLVSGGNMDSMVNHYTVAKHHRKTDSYTPGGVMGKRPDRAVTVYCNLIRKSYKHTPIIIGGIEASLRRLAQMLPEVPVDAQDVTMNRVFSEDKVYNSRPSVSRRMSAGMRSRIMSATGRWC